MKTTTHHVRWCILALAICSALFSLGANDASPTTEWFNDIVRARNRALMEEDRQAVKNNPSRGLLVRYVPKETDGLLQIKPGNELLEIGFRSDGVVVWRKAESNP